MVSVVPAGRPPEPTPRSVRNSGHWGLHAGFGAPRDQSKICANVMNPLKRGGSQVFSDAKALAL